MTVHPIALTPEQVTAEFKISRKTLYLWMRDRGLPHRRIGRLVRFDRGELQVWFDNQGSQPASQPAEGAA